jgi:phage repressor protein C with HTH and peptisase S24 domain
MLHSVDDFSVFCRMPSVTNWPEQRYDGPRSRKRLQRQPKEVIRVSSVDAAYDAFSVSLQDEGAGFAIVGRVVWVGRKLEF